MDEMHSISKYYTISGLALAALSAALLTFAFPPYNLGFLIWVGFVPMLVAQYRLLPTKFSSLAPAVAIGGWLGVAMVPMFGGKSIFMAAIPLIVGFITLMMDKNKRTFHERTGYRWFVLEGAVGWAGMEMIRSFIPVLATWFFVGYPLWSQPWLIQPVSVFGINGLDLLIMLGNYALAFSLLTLLNNPWKLTRPARNWLITFVIFLAVWTGLSLGLYSTSMADAPTIRVAAVQPGLPRAAHQDDSISPAQRLAIFAAQTREAAAKGAQIIVWPEMGLGFDPQVEHTQEVQALASGRNSYSAANAYIVIGYVVDDDPRGFRTEATVLAPSGQFLGMYGKTHPALFSGEPKTVTSGAYPVYDTPASRLATMICFDAHFTDVSRQYGRQGAQIIANPSLFGSSIAQSLHPFAVFRAVENHAAVVMADVAFSSAIVDPYGRVLKLSITPEGSATTLVADVRPGSGNTLYSRFGDWLGWISLAGLVFFAAFMTITLRKGGIRIPAE